MAGGGERRERWLEIYRREGIKSLRAFEVGRGTAPQYLSHHLRLYFGLQEWSNFTREQIRDVMGMTPRQFNNYEHWVSKQNHLTIQLIRDIGLPAEAAAPSVRYRCVVCHSWRIIVPCIECCRYYESYLHGDKALPDDFVAKPCKPTKAYPGTREKVMVLMQRVARGEELWHEQDAPNYPKSLT